MAKPWTIFAKSHILDVWLGYGCASAVRKKRRNISLFLGIYGEVITSKRISVRYSGDAYSFQCGVQSLIWGDWNVITLAVGWVGECCNEPSIWVVIP